MKKPILLKGLTAGLSLAAMTSMVACGGDSSSAASDEKSSASTAVDEFTVESIDDLPKCNSKNEEEVYTVSDEDADFVCTEDGDWVKIVSKLESSCKKDGETVYSKKDQDFFVCKDKKFISLEEAEEAENAKSSADADDEGEESSASKEEGDSSASKGSSDSKDSDDSSASNGSSSSATPASSDGASSSSARIEVIHGQTVDVDKMVLHETVTIMDTVYVTVEVVKKDETTGAVIKDETTGEPIVENQLIKAAPTTVISGDIECANAMFCGKTGVNRVNVGHNDNESSGWWWAYTDINEGGNSTFSWPYGIDQNDDKAVKINPDVAASLEATAGIKGTVIYGNKYKYPFAGLGFNIKDGSSYEDITSWGGVCVVYQSEKPMELQVVPGNSKLVTGYNNPRAILPATKGQNVVIDIEWGLFSQEDGWGKVVETSDVLETTAQLSFKFTGEPGESNDFIIYAFGTKGTCTGAPVINYPIDILEDKGNFSWGDGDFSAFRINTNNNDGNHAGRVEYTTNSSDENVVEFYTDEAYKNDDDDWETVTLHGIWNLQMVKVVELEPGFSYTVQLNAYDFTQGDKPLAPVKVDIGLQAGKDLDYENYAYNTWNSSDESVANPVEVVFNNCDVTNKKAEVYINGAQGEDFTEDRDPTAPIATGFHVQSIKVLKAPIDCSSAAK